MGVYDVETNIIKAIKDGKSLELFNIIGGRKRDSSLNLSHKRYYRRLSRLIATGLVKREKENTCSRCWALSYIEGS